MIKSLELNFFKVLYKLNHEIADKLANIRDGYRYELLLESINYIIPAEWVLYPFDFIATFEIPIKVYYLTAIDSISLHQKDLNCYISICTRNQTLQESQKKVKIYNKEKEFTDILLRKKQLIIDKYLDITIVDWLFNLEGWKINEENYFKLQKALFVLL